MEAENATYRKYKAVIPDGGWGWLVLFGCTLINLLIPGTIKSFGVLFVEFIETFKFSESAASWIPALCYFLYFSLGPLANFLSTKFSYKVVTLIGGTIASVGMILSFFASSVLQLCITYGVLFGTGAGLSFPPGIFIVTSYFQKYRGLANGIAISGSAFGSMVLPPLLRFLVESYGVSGAVLIMGAITLNVWVGALFYHPVSWHMKKIPIPLNNHELNVTTTEQPDTEKSQNDHVTHTERDNIREETTLMSDSSEKIGQHRITKYVFTPEGKKHSLTCSIFANSQNSLKRNSSYLSIASLKYIASSQSTLARLPESASRLTLTSLSARNFSCCKANTKNTTDSDSMQLFKNPIFIIILFSNATTAIGYTNFTIFLPAYAISLDYDKTKSSCLLSIIAFFDLIGRIGGSTISDILPLHKKYYFILGLMISGISLVILPLMQTYNTLCITCAMFGLSSGTYTGITVVTMVEMLGEDKLATSYTISLFINGVLQLIGPPVCGVIYTNFNSYNAIIGGLGIIITLGAAVWATVPFIPSKEN